MKTIVVLLSILFLSGCATVNYGGDTPEQFAAKAALGTILNQTGLGAIAGIESQGAVRIKSGLVLRNARGEEIAIIPRTEGEIRVP